MNEGEEIRFIDLYSGVGGFRRGLEKANEERRFLRRQDMHGHRTDADERLKHGREAPGGHISQESPSGSEIGLEKAGYRVGQSLSERGRVGEDIRSEGISSSPDAERREASLEQLPEDNRFRCVWSCDNNKYANQIYAKHFGEANHHPGDIRGVDPREIPDFDLLCAGFPCQSFSVAGKRQGFQDTRGTLFFEISRIAEAKRPQMLLLENVKGILSSDRGQTFKTILQELGRIGYWAEWQIFNSKHHGVPQNRERVFIIGHSRNGRSRPIFPIGKTDEMAEEDGRGRSPVQLEVSTAIDGSYYKGVDRHGQRTVVGVTLANTSRYNQGVKRSPLKQDETSFALGSAGDQGVAVSFTNPHNPEEERKVNLSSLSRAVKPPYGNQQPLVLRPKDDWFSQHAIYPSDGVGPTLRGNQNDPAPRILHNLYGGFKEGIRTFEEHSPTIRTAKGGGHIPSVLQDYRIRRLTPVECELLQSFPKNWTKHGITFLTPDTYIRDNADAEKTNTLEILSTMWEAVGTEQGKGWGLRELISLLKKEILQPRVYEGIIQEKMEGPGSSSTGKLQSETIDYCDGMLDMWQKIKPRYSPQRQRQIEQLFRKLTSSLSRVPHQITSQGRRMESTTNSGKRQNGKICLIHWLSDTQRYKCLGNAVTTNVIAFLGRKIMEAWS